MILRNRIQKVRLEHLALPRRNAINPPIAHLQPRAKKTLPPSDGIRADNGVRSGEIQPVVLRAAALAVKQGEVVFCCCAVEFGLVVRGC